MRLLNLTTNGQNKIAIDWSKWKEKGPITLPILGWFCFLTLTYTLICLIIIKRVTYSLQGSIGIRQSPSLRRADALLKKILRNGPVEPGFHFQRKIWDSSRNPYIKLTGAVSVCLYRLCLCNRWTDMVLLFHVDPRKFNNYFWEGYRHSFKSNRP